MNEYEILEWLTELIDNEQYSTVSFDEISFTNAMLATCLQALHAVSKRHRSYWDKFNVEFCKGPVDLILCTGLALNCFKSLFVAGDGSNEDDIVVKVAAALRINISLRSLWILHPLRLEDALALGDALSINDALDKLSLSGCKWEWPDAVLENEDAPSDASATEGESFRDTISQWTMSESDDDVEFLEERLRDPALAAEAMKLPRALASGFQYNTSLRAIDLSSCGLPDEALGIVLQALVGHSTLQTLDVSKNRAGRQTIGALAEIVAHPDSNLIELDLREQRKVSKMAKQKKRGVFRRKKTEEEEDTFGDGDDGLDLIPLSQAMYNNETLQVLKLSHNQLTDDQVAELVRNLQGNETLTELDLQYNTITARGLQALTKGLSHLPSLKVLLLGGNDFGKEGNKILAQLEDDDDSVCTILEEGVSRDEDDETFHSAKSSTAKLTSSPRKTNAASRAKAFGGGLMGGLTGISEK
jgi:Leucine Rich repeat